MYKKQRHHSPRYGQRDFEAVILKFFFFLKLRNVALIKRLGKKRTHLADLIN